MLPPLRGESIGKPLAAGLNARSDRISTDPGHRRGARRGARNPAPPLEKVTRMAQAVAIVIAALLVITALKDKAHALGIWLTILMTHGVIVHVLGPGATNLPLFVGLALVPFLLKNKGGFHIDPVYLLLVTLFLTAGAFSAILNEGDFSALRKLGVYVKPMLLCALILGGVEDRRTLSVIAAYIIASGVFGGLFNAYQQVFGAFWTQAWDPSLNRATGLRGDANDTAMLLLLAVPLAYVWLINAKSLPGKVLAAVSLSLIAVGVVLTGSRAGFLALVIVALLLTFHQVHSRRRSLFGIARPRKVIIAAVFAGFAALAAPGYYWERMSTLVSGEEVGGAQSLYGRAELLRRGIDTWLNNPLLGVGAGQFGRAFSSESRTFSGDTAGPVAHNMYVEFLAEFGLLGAAPMFVIFFIALVRFYRLDATLSPGVQSGRHVGFGYALGFFAMLLMGFTLSQGYNSVFWFVIGLGLSAKRLGLLEGSHK